MNNNDFDKKYGITKELNYKLKFSTAYHNSNSVVGKPKVLILEILKRFFKNPMVLISFVVFIALIFVAIYVSSTSPYLASRRIDYTWDDAHKTSHINNLPPVFSRFVPANFGDEVSKNLERLQNNPYTKEYSIIKDLDLNGSSNTFYYDAYAYRYGMHLYADIAKWERDNHKTITPDVVQQLKADIYTIHTYFGTTASGSDIWTTLWVGTLQSLKIAFIVAIVETVVGVAVGAYLGFHAGKWLDTVMMRIIEIFQAPPSIIWLLLFVSVWGTSDSILILGLLFVGWTWPIDSARMFTITVKDEEYILAAKSIGASTPRQVYLHALPAVMGKLAMNFVRRIPSIILTIASLAFLGFYNDDNSANLGKFMLDNLADSQNNAWLLILPASILLLLSLSLQFVAIGLHDALDPRVVKVR